jgi:hypothetical protein
MLNAIPVKHRRYLYRDINWGSRLIGITGSTHLFLDEVQRYLNNSYLLYAFANENADAGNIRETFFVNQISAKYAVNILQKSYFLVENYVFEVCGRWEKSRQAANVPNSYFVDGYSDFCIE